MAVAVELACGVRGGLDVNAEYAWLMVVIAFAHAFCAVSTSLMVTPVPAE